MEAKPHPECTVLRAISGSGFWVQTSTVLQASSWLCAQSPCGGPSGVLGSDCVRGKSFNPGAASLVLFLLFGHTVLGVHSQLSAPGSLGPRQCRGWNLAPLSKACAQLTALPCLQLSLEADSRETLSLVLLLAPGGEGSTEHSGVPRSRAGSLQGPTLGANMGGPSGTVSLWAVKAATLWVRCRKADWEAWDLGPGLCRCPGAGTGTDGEPAGLLGQGLCGMEGPEHPRLPGRCCCPVHVCPPGWAASASQVVFPQQVLWPSGALSSVPAPGHLDACPGRGVCGSEKG